MDLKKAFTYMFADRHWPSKLIIGALVLLVPILNFAWIGYLVELRRRVMRGEMDPLPGWDNFGRKFVDGLMLFLAKLVYALPILVLVGIPLAILIPSGILAANSNSQSAGIGGLIGGSMALLCAVGVLCLYGLMLVVIYPAIYVEYARTGKFGACFNFKAIFRSIGAHSGAYFTAWGLSLGVGIGASIAAGIVGSILFWIPFLSPLVGIAAGIYVVLVSGHLFGQYGGMEEAGAPLPAEQPPLVA